METYSESRLCVKCGPGDLLATFCPKGGASWKDTHPGERMHRICQRCRYAWDEEALRLAWLERMAEKEGTR